MILFGVPETQMKTSNTDRSGLPILLCILENRNETPQTYKIMFSGAGLIFKRLNNNFDAIWRVWKSYLKYMRQRADKDIKRARYCPPCFAWTSALKLPLKPFQRDFGETADTVAFYGVTNFRFLCVICKDVFKKVKYNVCMYNKYQEIHDVLAARNTWCTRSKKFWRVSKSEKKFISFATKPYRHKALFAATYKN